MAYYNENSFYLLEVNGEQNSISNISFERLDNQNVPIGAWPGSRWAQFYPVIRPGACVRIEILSSNPYLHPKQCQTYYSTRTPIRTDPGIFWTWDPGSNQFRVLWQGKEVGRCATGSSTCEFSIP